MVKIRFQPKRSRGQQSESPMSEKKKTDRIRVRGMSSSPELATRRPDDGHENGGHFRKLALRRHVEGWGGQNPWGRALGGLIYFAVKLLVRGRRSQDVNNIAEDAVSTSAPGRRSDFSITLSLNKNLSDVFL